MLMFIYIFTPISNLSTKFYCTHVYTCIWLIHLYYTDYVVMYAGDEAARGEVVVKDMRRSSQTVVPESQLETFLAEAKASFVANGTGMSTSTLPTS